MTDVTSLRTYLSSTYPEYDSEKIIEDNEESISKANRFFEELDTAYDEREKYNLHWAYKQASNSFKEVSKEVSSSNSVEHEQEEVLSSMKEGITQEINKASRRYSLLSRTTLFLDIFISVILILVVTFIAQLVEGNLESVLYSTLFIGFIALCKVSLDRFLIIPKIDKWGWKKYNQLTEIVTARLMQILTLKLVMKEAMLQQENQLKFMDIISRGQEKFYPKRNFSLFPNRSSVPLNIFPRNISTPISTVILED